jgi:hypothetical protein
MNRVTTVARTNHCPTFAALFLAASSLARMQTIFSAKCLLDLLILDNNGFPTKLQGREQT